MAKKKEKVNITCFFSPFRAKLKPKKTQYLRKTQDKTPKTQAKFLKIQVRAYEIPKNYTFYIRQFF